jgi:hypothetical protein
VSTRVRIPQGTPVLESRGSAALPVKFGNLKEL